MFDPVVKKKQPAPLSSPGTSSSAGSLPSTTKSHTESSSFKRKDKVASSLPCGEVSILIIITYK
jgi:hypothetical protein